MNSRVRHRRVGTSELAAVPMLAQLPCGPLGDLAAAAPARSFGAGEILLRQGDPANRLLIMLDGQATAVTDHADGSRSRYPLMTAPCVLDKAAVLAGMANPASWVAATPGRAVILSAAQFRLLLAQQPTVREHVLHYMAVQVNQVRTTLSGRAGFSAATQVAAWLITASRAAGTAVIRLPAGQQGIAEELGLSRVTVNRALQHLVRTGAIRIRPRIVIILEPAALASITG
jgi:CRP/FNR family transcriptional regulator, cyclic AMP receptor protein